MGFKKMIHAEGGLVEVGAHILTHSVLSTLPAATQRDEILESKACLEEIPGQPVTSFSYPYG
jgi:peptidoglycan/xylan/chitin deacetylase (PgdA/CDA1 family)